MELHSILRSLQESGLQSKEEVREIITKIEKKDNTMIKDENAEIFSQPAFNCLA